MVLMCEEDEFETRQRIGVAIPDSALCGSKIVVRQGDPQETGDLDRVSISSAKTVIILGSSGKPIGSDQQVLRTVLSGRALPQGISGLVLCEIRIEENLHVLKDISQEEAQGIMTRDTVMRVLCIAILCTGLGEVFMDAMSFADGEEPYFKSCEKLDGLKVDDVGAAFPGAVMLGVCSENGTGTLEMPPRNGRVLK